MIGWVIMAALLVPALALGRWADREWRRTRAEADPELNEPPVRTRHHAHGSGQPVRSSVTGGRGSGRGAGRRSRTYAER